MVWRTRLIKNRFLFLCVIRGLIHLDPFTVVIVYSKSAIAGAGTLPIDPSTLTRNIENSVYINERSKSTVKNGKLDEHNDNPPITNRS